MSAREDLEALLEFYGVGPVGRQKVQYAVADLLHEEAEKIRASRLETPEGFTHRESWVNAWNSGRDDSADLIDPYAK